MAKANRDIILLIKDEDIQRHNIDMEVRVLHEMIAAIETVDSFCNAHELVNRNAITRKKNKIIDAISEDRLKPFQFLINKN